MYMHSAFVRVFSPVKLGGIVVYVLGVVLPLLYGIPTVAGFVACLQALTFGFTGYSISMEELNVVGVPREMFPCALLHSPFLLYAGMRWQTLFLTTMTPILPFLIQPLSNRVVNNVMMSVMVVGFFWYSVNGWVVKLSLFSDIRLRSCYVS